MKYFDLADEDVLAVLSKSFLGASVCSRVCASFFWVLSMPAFGS